MRCFNIFEEYYDVHTHWGWFRLDEGAYRDYLQNKMWITWKPKSVSASTHVEKETILEQYIPPCVTEEAIRLRDEATKKDVFLFVQERFPHIQVAIPYKTKMEKLSINELSLSVRASNCLMRSGASTFGALHGLINSEIGLRSIRNLGLKSESEIIHCFFVACYYLLTAGEKAQFWQRIIDSES